MRRREFITLLGGAAAAWPLGARAQKGTRPAYIGFISGLDKAGAAGFIDAFRDGLAGRGYVEPSTLKIDTLFADSVLDRIPALIEELERRRVDIIVTHASATESVVRGHRTIPAVYEFSADPVSLGIATDLAHPLFNSTGITLMVAELNSKRLELLHEIVPDLRRIAVIANPLHPGVEFERRDSDAKARQLGIQISFFPTANRAELDRAFDAIAADLPQAMLVFSEGFVVENRQYILNFAMSRHIPVVSGWAVMAESGAVCTYGPRLVESYRRVTYLVDRILQGAKPAELPIEQPTVLELVVNLKSAKILGLTIPPNVLVQANTVIE
jgi:putative tryptophan/tyrosine transport system substrate-binding protein